MYVSKVFHVFAFLEESSSTFYVAVLFWAVVIGAYIIATFLFHLFLL